MASILTYYITLALVIDREAGMAQRAISEYYTVRKRSSNHGSDPPGPIKRKKEMVSSQQNETSATLTRAARGRPRRKVGGSSPKLSTFWSFEVVSPRKSQE